MSQVGNTLLQRDVIETLPDRSVEVVADLHLNPYYGDEDETEALYSLLAKRGTTTLMPSNVDSKVCAKVWLTPNQVDALRNACYEQGAEYLRQRNDAIIALMYDTGLRVGELIAVDVGMLREGNTELYLPAETQKDYPNNNSPTPSVSGSRRISHGCCRRTPRLVGKIVRHPFPHGRVTDSPPKAFAISSPRQLHSLASSPTWSTVGAAIPTT